MKMYCAPARALEAQARTSEIHSSECFMQSSLLGVPAGEIARMHHGFLRWGGEISIAATKDGRDDRRCMGASPVPAGTRSVRPRVAAKQRIRAVAPRVRLFTSWPHR